MVVGLWIVRFAVLGKQEVPVGATTCGSFRERSFMEMGCFPNIAAVHPDGPTPAPPPAPLPTRALLTKENIQVCTLCCTFCCLLPILLAILMWCLIPIKHQHAHYTFDEISISGLQPSALNASLITGTLNIKTSFRFQASNPGKTTRFSYSDIDVTVETMGLVIGYTQFSPFDLGHKSTKSISGYVQSGSLNFQEVSEADVLAVNEFGKVRLTMKLFVRGRRATKDVLWTTFRRSVVVNFSMDIDVNTRNMAGAPESQ